MSNVVGLGDTGGQSSSSSSGGGSSVNSPAWPSSTSSSSGVGGRGPPPHEHNPVLAAYEQYRQDTPWVTRCLLSTLVVSYLLSWVFWHRMIWTLGNIPLHTLWGGEIYRLLTSPMICTSLLSLVFAVLTLLDTGKRLERRLGSTNYLWMIVFLVLLMNLAFNLVCILLYYSSSSSTSSLDISSQDKVAATANDSTLASLKDESYLIQSSFGVWSLLLALIAVECGAALPASQRRLFFLQVPTLYYPVVLFFLFSLFSGGALFLAHALSVAVGYAQARGYLDRITVLLPTTVARWETGWLEGWTRNPGYVTQQSAGTIATGDEADQGNGSGGGWQLPLVQSPPSPQAEGGGGGNEGWTPSVFSRPTTTATNADSGGGHVLGSSNTATSQRRDGGSTTSSTTDAARAARLAAAERRAAAASQSSP